MMIFVPLSAAQLAALVASGELGPEVAGLEGFTATPALRRDAEIGSADDEEADFVAFGYAGVAAVALTTVAAPGRVVVACDLPPAAVAVDEHDPCGRTAVPRLRWRDVTAVYLDEPDAAAAVARAREATTGLGLDDAYAHPTVQALLDDHDLLWHLPSEVAH